MSEFKNISEKQKAELSRVLGLDARKAYTPQGFIVLQGISSNGVQSNMQEQNKVPVTASRKLDSNRRAQSGFDRVLNRD